MRIPIKRHKKEEVNNAVNDLVGKGWKRVTDTVRVSNEGAYHKKEFYIAYCEKVK